MVELKGFSDTQIFRTVRLKGSSNSKSLEQRALQTFPSSTSPEQCTWTGSDTPCAVGPANVHGVFKTPSFTLSTSSYLHLIDSCRSRALQEAIAVELLKQILLERELWGDVAGNYITTALEEFIEVEVWKKVLVEIELWVGGSRRK